MWTIIGVLAGLAVVFGGLWWLWPALAPRLYRPELRADDVVFAITPDARRLPLLRYRPPGAATRRHPVILCPGLASNRYSFDLGVGTPSLAVYLAERGFEVFAVELRGEGHGDHVSGTWNFDDFVERDAPSLVARVLEVTGAPAVHWVGHSMGGMVLLAAIARGLADVRSAVTLGSALAFAGTDHALGEYARLKPALKRVSTVPYGRLARILAPLAARWRHNPIDALNINVDNCDGSAVRRLDAVGFTTVSPDVALQLITATEPGGLRSQHADEPPFIELLAARPDPPPILLMAGEGDPQCPAEAIARVGRTHGRFETRVVGPSNGAVMAYGHFDMLMGVRADAEVFPHVVDWLEAHDGSA